MNAIKPTVSVIMPVYNAERFLKQAVTSVQSQSVSDWELLLVEDASTDNSAAVAAQLAAEDHRIRLLHNERNLGVAETRNRGVREARGEWVALLDSDDLWQPDKLKKQLSLARETGADIVYCSYGLIDENGASCCDVFIVPEATDLNRMLERSVISCSTALIRRKCMLAHPFRNDFAHEDLVLWLDLLRAGYKARGCREVLAAYRLSQNSRSSNKWKAAVGRWHIYRKYIQLPFLRSCVLFLRYAVAATQKYKRT